MSFTEMKKKSIIFKVNYKKITKLVFVKFVGMMEILLQANLIKTNLMGKDSILIKVEIFIRELLLAINSMEKEF